MSLELYLNELEKQAQENQRLEDMSIEELAKMAGIKDIAKKVFGTNEASRKMESVAKPGMSGAEMAKAYNKKYGKKKQAMAKCPECGAMYKKGEMTKCSCGAKLAEAGAMAGAGQGTGMPGGMRRNQNPVPCPDGQQGGSGGGKNRALPPALAANKEKVKAVQDPKKPGAEVPADLGKSAGALKDTVTVLGKGLRKAILKSKTYKKVPWADQKRLTPEWPTEPVLGLLRGAAGGKKGMRKALDDLYSNSGLGMQEFMRAAKLVKKGSAIQKIAETDPRQQYFEDMRSEALEADPRHMGKFYGTAGAIGGAGAGGLAAIPLAKFLPGRAKLLAGLAPVAGGVAGGLLGRRAGEQEAQRSGLYRQGLGQAAMRSGAQQGYQAGTRAGAVAYHRALQRALAQAQAAKQGPVKEGSAASEVTKQVAEKAAPFVSRLHPSIIPGILGAVGGAAVGAAHSDSDNRLRNAIAGGITGATLGATGGAVAREFGLGRQQAGQLMKNIDDALYEGVSIGGKQGAEAVLRQLGTTAEKAKKVSGSSWRKALARLAGL